MKSFIKKLYTVNSRNIFYINFEIDDFQIIDDNEKLKDFFDNYFLLNIDKNKKIYVFLDEIQYVKNWEKFVNSLLAKFSGNIEIFISWSNANLLSSELSTYLSGRYIEFLIVPFMFEEYVSFTKHNTDYINYLRNTWLPEWIKLSKLEDKEILINYFKSLKNTIILKDIVSRYKIKDIFLLETLFDFLIDNIWNLFSLNSITKKLKSQNIITNHNTIWSYLYYLENVFLIYWVHRYDLKGKKILEVEKKYYINDLWFRNYTFSEYDLWMGKHLENYVFLLLKKYWFEIFVWKIKDLEIDFIATKWDKKLYIQVSYDISNEEVFEREIKPFFEFEEKWVFYLITFDDKFNWIHKWINITNINKFESLIGIW